ncbi:pilus assembly protein PilM [[Clostridium] symbiosum]|uniref:pilus assembly protein PilM n=1 Tax=Clostridium symbiosum TaxID=1512 RepID=UPI001D06CD47|nr:pilus assembly protein PilM [[Clostridium] symbiosum]MCB6610336.1 pilus assembly protein PilM [[Clostridium] symbiosum]MCB6932000.1 pilus assembly protein PilM [[Clostridium] symbiosum]
MGKLLSIVLNDNHIRIAELSEGRRGVTVYRLLTKEVPESLVSGGIIVDVRGFGEYLNSTLKYANIKTKKVVFSLPSDRIMSREVVLPEMNEEKLKTALRVNAPEYFPVELTDYVLSYFTISRVVEEETESEEEDGEEPEKKKPKKKKKRTGKKKKSKLRLMVVAAPNDMVQSYYDAAKLAHLKLISLDYIGNSVFQLTSNQIGDEPCLVIQLDEEHTVLTIYNDTVMVLQRHVDFGSITLLQAVMEKKNCSEEDAQEILERRQLIHNNFDDGDELTDNLYYLVSNIKRVIEYYTGRNVDQPLELIYIIGDGSHIGGLDGLFENQLHLPVEMITALKQVTVRESSGISMKEVLRYMDNIGAVIDPVGMIPKQLEQDIRRKVEAKAYRIMILLALFLSVVIITIPAVDFFSEAMETIDLQNRLLTVEDVKPILENYKQAQSRYSDVGQIQAMVRTDNESLSDFITIFEQLRPSNISIQSFSCSEGQVSFSALAEGKKTVARLIQQLNMIANVSEVKVSALSSVFEGDKETVAFSLTCILVNQDSLLNPGTRAEALGNLMPEEYSDIWDPEGVMDGDKTENGDTEGDGGETIGAGEKNTSGADTPIDGQERLAREDGAAAGEAAVPEAAPALKQGNTAASAGEQINTASVQPQAQAVTPTEAPVQPQTPLVQPQTPPVQPQTPPIQPQTPPVQPQMPPAEAETAVMTANAGIMPAAEAAAQPAPEAEVSIPDGAVLNTTPEAAVPAADPAPVPEGAAAADGNESGGTAS